MKNFLKRPHIYLNMHTLRDLASSNDDNAWRFYNSNFRCLRETNIIPWQLPIPELMVKACIMPKPTKQSPFGVTIKSSFATTSTMEQNASIPFAHTSTFAKYVGTPNQNRGVPEKNPQNRQNQVIPTPTGQIIFNDLVCLSFYHTIPTFNGPDRKAF